MITIDIDIKGLLAGLTDLEKRQLPFAMVTGLNITAEELKTAVQHEMKDSFNRPTPYTLRGVRVRRATKQSLEAEVSLQDAGGRNRPSQYLKPEIKGGPRNLKGYELQMGGRFTVPGKDFPRDAYGNIRGGVITRALNDLGILRGQVTSRTSSESKAAAERLAAKRTKRGTSGKPVCFLGAPGGGRLPLGIWERRKIGKYWVVRPVLIFVDSPNYQPRLDWEFTARMIWKSNFQVNFQQGMAYALAIAKR